MLHTAVQVAQEAAEHSAGGIPPVVLGALAFGGLVAALLVTYAFRNVNNRH
ncbi:hypothetical protein [Isoptericola cucumis]|uniref:Uncharacterized protein n=1 Tax=Isoptericola cucumis TaxID=1776856 RepID=A0ABQ2B4G8_9MICO|nr:hypothetical protein [Isoptericola cucumis]GGI06263.1 hypothetical protein GCM10007368_10290 [Isoptericola cucumis]